MTKSCQVAAVICGWWLFWVLLYEAGWVAPGQTDGSHFSGTVRRRSPARPDVCRSSSALSAGPNTLLLSSDSYRLAPKYHFPAQFEDVYSVTEFFLQSSVLSRYGVDPDRVCVAGDSAGGNLAAAVAQQVTQTGLHIPLFSFLVLSRPQTNRTLCSKQAHLPCASHAP